MQLVHLWGVQFLQSALLSLLLTVFAVSASGSPAHAQDKDALRDVVVLRDGGFVRGTLVEYAPGQYAVLQTRAGQTRRFEAAELVYAGPAHAMPTPHAQPAPAQAPESPAPLLPPTAEASESNAPSPAPTLPVQTVVNTPTSPKVARVQFLADEPLQVFERTGVSTTLYGNATGESYAPLCIAPCDATLAPGTHMLALARPNEAPRRANELTLRDGSRVQARYQSRMGVRVGGFVIGIAGLAGSVALMFSGIDEDGLNNKFWGGVVLGGVSTVASLIMTNIPDRAQVDSAP